MNNVTYLIGAGASANTLPIVSNMVVRLAEVGKFLSSHEKTGMNSSAWDTLPENVKNFNSHIKDIKHDLFWLSEESSKHQTIDTLAKKYYLTGSHDLLFKLKRALISFFTLEQLLFIPSFAKGEYTFVKKKELRYDSFFAALLENKDNNSLKMPNNIKFLSWNYDQQFELGLKNYVGASLNHLKTFFQVIPNKNTAESISSSVYDKNRFTCVKLNGTASFLNPTIISENNTASVFDYYDPKLGNSELLGHMLKEYDTIRMLNNGKHLEESLLHLNFSWESDKSFSGKYPSYYSHKSAAIEIAKETEYLVIIGYSFPVFNRAADRELIDKMTKLKKIYIQDPNCETIQSTITNGFTILQSRVQDGVRVTFHLEKDTNQFLIPYEL